MSKLANQYTLSDKVSHLTNEELAQLIAENLQNTQSTIYGYQDVPVQVTYNVKTTEAPHFNHDTKSLEWPVAWSINENGRTQYGDDVTTAVAYELMGVRDYVMNETTPIDGQAQADYEIEDTLEQATAMCAEGSPNC